MLKVVFCSQAIIPFFLLEGTSLRPTPTPFLFRLSRRGMTRLYHRWQKQWRCVLQRALLGYPCNNGYNQSIYLLPIWVGLPKKEVPFSFKPVYSDW